MAVAERTTPAMYENRRFSLLAGAHSSRPDADLTALVDLRRMRTG